MSTLERYIFRQLLGPFGFFVLVLTGVVWLTQTLTVIDVVVNNGQGARVFLEFSLLLMPRVLSIVLQLGALAAAVFAINRMMSESEIIAAQSFGAGRLRLTRPIAVFGLAVAAMLAVDTLYLMPTATRELRDRMAEVTGDLATGLIRDGRFLNPVEGLTIYIREIDSDGTMRGVLIEDASTPGSPITYTAERGEILRGEAAPLLRLFDGQIQRYDRETARFSMIDFRQTHVDLSNFVEERGPRFLKVSERYFWELIDPPEEIASTPRARARAISEGHEQLSSPLYGLALPLVAAAAMLGAGFSRRGAGPAIAAALVAGAATRVAGIAIKSAASNSEELWPLLYAPPVIAIVVSLIVLSRARMPAGARRGGGGSGAPLGAPAE